MTGGMGLDFLIRRVFLFSADIADCGTQDTFDSLKLILCTPETSAGKYGLFLSHVIRIFYMSLVIKLQDQIYKIAGKSQHVFTDFINVSFILGFLFSFYVNRKGIVGEKTLFLPKIILSIIILLEIYEKTALCMARFLPGRNSKCPILQ